MTALGALAGRFARDRSGSFTVEFAVMAPMIMLMIGGMVDYGAMTYQSMALQSAARSTAEYLRSHPSDLAGATLFAASASALEPDGLVVSSGAVCECPGGAPVPCTDTCGGALPKLYLAVTVAQDWHPLLPYPWVAAPLQLQGAATLRAR